jgi:hypothetical protein
MTSQPDNVQTLLTLTRTVGIGGGLFPNSSDSINELVHVVLIVMSDSDSCRSLLQLRDVQAQSVVNCLHWVGEHHWLSCGNALTDSQLLHTNSSFDLPQRVGLRNALCRLSMSSKTLPASFLLPRITKARRVCRRDTSCGYIHGHLPGSGGLYEEISLLPPQSREGARGQYAC